MRYAALILILLAGIVSAQADEPDEISAIEICRDISLIAKDVMTARQNKEPMSEILPATIKQLQKWAEKYGQEMSSQAAEDIAAPLVIGAYDVGAYPDGSAWNPERREAIHDFENDFFEECYEGWTSE